MSEPRLRPGAPQRLASNRSLDLDGGSDRLHRLESGHLELFAEPRENGRATGPRFHLGSLAAGDLVVEFASGPLTVVAVATEPSELVPSELRQETTPLLERWIDNLFAVVPGPTAPHHFTTLAVGPETALHPKKLAAKAAEGLLWARLAAGPGHFLGLAESPLDGDAVPLSTRLWMTGDATTQLAAETSDGLLERGELAPALAAFHDRYLAYLEQVRRERDDNERERVAAARDLDQRALEGATRRLVSLLDSRGERRPVSADQDPLVTVCRLIGDRQGFEIRLPPDPETGQKRKHRLAEICASSNLRSRRVLLRDDWWRRDNGPLLALRMVGEDQQERRSVALLPTSARRYEMVDPVAGTRQEVDADLAEELDGNAWMFYPPLPQRPVTPKDLLRAALRGRRDDLTMLLMMGLAGGLLGMAVPLITGRLFGQVIPSADRPQLYQLGLALVVSAVAAAVFQIVRGIAVLRLGAKVDGSVQAALWDRLLSLPMAFFRRYTVGDLADRSLGLDSIRELLTGSVTSSLLTAVFSLFSFALLFYYEWRLALVATAVVVVLVLLTALLTILQVRRQRPLFEIQGRIASLLLGLINGISKLRVGGAEQRGYALWARRFAEQRQHELGVRRIANAQTALNALYGVIASLTIFAMLGLSQKIEMPMGDFLAFTAAFSQFLSSSLAIIGVFSSVLTMVPIYERLSPILEAAPEVDAEGVDPGPLRGDIEFSHVSFRYAEDGPLILDDVSFRARPGELVALVGPSGSGKSTCIRLLLGFETPEAGSLYFDGQDLSSLALPAVRRQIGVVLQNGQPMVGDIYSNIVGSSNLGMEAAWEAAAMAGLAEDIAAMPMKMHTVISEGAGTFSGGQKQRLLIARAVVHRPRILLFDEATSALDNRTQEIVSQSLEKLDATRIVVAHRLSTVINADRIFVIERGRVVESGTYGELAAAGGVFSRLVERQTL